jgi:hypothetical protein
LDQEEREVRREEWDLLEMIALRGSPYPWSHHWEGEVCDKVIAYVSTKRR